MYLFQFSLLIGTEYGITIGRLLRFAKCLNTDTIPNELTLGGLPVAPGQAASSFAGYFSNKVRENVSKNVIDPDNVYNGKCKLIVQN